MLRRWLDFPFVASAANKGPAGSFPLNSSRMNIWCTPKRTCYDVLRNLVVGGGGGGGWQSRRITKTLAFTQFAHYVLIK